MTVTPIREEITYRCHVCLDRGWVFTNEPGVGNDAVKRCKGPMETACPYDEWAVKRAKELHPASRGRRQREEL